MFLLAFAASESGRVPPDAALAERLLKRDGRAFEELYDRHSWLVYGLAVRILRQAGTAEEVVQDAFLQLWHQASEGHVSRDPFLPWLLTVARNRALDRLGAASELPGQGQQRTEEPVRVVSARPDPAGEPDEKLRAVRVRELMAALEPHQRRAMELAFFEGLTASQIATELQEPLSSVKSWIRNGLLTLSEAGRGRRVTNGGSNQDPFREQMEAYALGALDAQDRAALEAHLDTGCALCAKALAEGRWLASQLAYLAPAAEPSERLRGRLLETVRAEAGAPEPGVTGLRGQTIPWWMWGAIAGALLFTLYNSWNRAREQALIEDTGQKVAQLVEEQQRSEQELALARREALILTNPQSIKIVLSPARKGLPALEAIWHHRLGLVVTGGNLPAPAVHRTLQLWLISKSPGSNAVASSTLRPALDGRFDLLVLRPPVSLGATKALAVTEEPEGGSLEPTTTPTWSGAVGGTQGVHAPGRRAQ